MNTIEVTIPADTLVLIDGNQMLQLKLGDKIKIIGNTDLHTKEGKLIEITNPNHCVVERAAKRKHTHVIRIHRE